MTLGECTMKDEAVQVVGGCLCGSVRFQGMAYLRSAYYCHCTICQKSSGAPFEIGVLIKAGTLRFLEGAPTYYQSSSFGKRGFCAVCGSRLLWAPTDANDDWSINVAVCALDNPTDVQPSCHTYTDTKLSWLHIADELPRVTDREMPTVIERWKAELLA
jgi:hypothetical protein